MPTATCVSARSCCCRPSTTRASPIVMAQAIDDPNDRLREVAYCVLRAAPGSVACSGAFLEALDKEPSEFVRPSLVRALAAHGARPARAAGAAPRGHARAGFLPRARVIEALGDHKARLRRRRAHRPSRSPTARCRTMRRWRWGRWATGRRSPCWRACSGRRRSEHQPAVAAAICLLGVNCEAHRGFLVGRSPLRTITAGFQVARAASRGLARARRIAGERRRARARSSTIGIPSQDPARAPIALARRPWPSGNPDAAAWRCSSRGDDRARRVCCSRDGLRHARGGLRRGAVLRRGAERVLGSGRGIADAGRQRRRLSGRWISEGQAAGCRLQPAGLLGPNLACSLSLQPVA